MNAMICTTACWCDEALELLSRLPTVRLETKTIRITRSLQRFVSRKISISQQRSFFFFHTDLHTWYEYERRRERVRVCFFSYCPCLSCYFHVISTTAWWCKEPFEISDRIQRFSASINPGYYTSRLHLYSSF